MKTNWIALAIFAGLPFVAAPASAGVSGTLKYLDYGSTAQPARRVTVDIYALDGRTLLETVRTDNNGAYTSNAVSATGYVVKARAINDGSSVRDGANPVYTVDAGTIGAAGGAIPLVTFDAKAGTNAERAFAVADALQTSWLHAGIVRPGATAVLPTVFGNVDNTGASYFDSGTGSIYITQRRRLAGDVLGHEYGHYLASLDNLDQSPAGDHTFGVSNIPANPTSAQKTDGVRLAWGEGIASYIGTSAQALAAHPNSPTLGNTAFESFDADATPNGLFGADFESASTSVGGVAKIAVGEGDELSTARVLWDIADSTNETHDRISLGHKTTYEKLSAGHYTSLGTLWTGLTNAVTDAVRVDYGGIFQINGASPDPEATTVIGNTLTAADPAPTFSWTRGNDNANDTFGLIVWDTLFNTRILDITGLTDVTSYTLNAGQWAFLSNYQGTVNFVVTGSDTTGFATPSYFSDAYQFNIMPVPEPATAMLLIAPATILLRRRR